MTINQIRVQFKTACQILDISREKLRHLQCTDETFPKAIKIGEAKQSPIYFDYLAIIKWHNKQVQNQSFQQFNQLCADFNMRQNEASQSARHMAHWKKEKPIILKRIETLKKHLQLDLFNDEESEE